LGKPNELCIRAHIAPAAFGIISVIYWESSGMKKTIWQVDADTTVQLQMGAFGRRALSVNGTEVQRWRCTKREDSTDLVLPTSLKKAHLRISYQFLGQVTTDLRVDGRLMVRAEDLVKCTGCGTTPKAYDTFCASCGRALAPPEDYAHIRQLKWARNSIAYLGVMFVVFGVIVSLVTKNPTVLAINLILGAVMGALFLWSKRAPLAAIIVASGTYLVVVTTNALIDPRSLGQGLVLKILIIAALAKGVKSALALRERDA